MSEEDSARSLKLRRNEREQEEKELERVDDRPIPVTEGHNSEDDSDELHQLSVLFRTTPILPLRIDLKKPLTKTFKKKKEIIIIMKQN